MPTDYAASDFASRYATARALSQPVQNIWVEVLRRVTGGRDVAAVVDIGAGAGRFWPVFAQAWDAPRIVAIDRSASMLRHGPSASAVLQVLADMQHPPIRDDSVDVVFCSMVLHYADAANEIVRNLGRLLAPRGVLCVRTGTRNTIDSYDFLRYFPTARRAEWEAMPSAAELGCWFEGAEWPEVVTEVVELPPEPSRWLLVRAVWARGFPSLQLVPRVEFVVGFVRYALAVLACGVLRRSRSGERTMLVSAVRR